MLDFLPLIRGVYTSCMQWLDWKCVLETVYHLAFDQKWGLYKVVIDQGKGIYFASSDANIICNQFKERGLGLTVTTGIVIRGKVKCSITFPLI